MAENPEAAVQRSRARPSSKAKADSEAKFAVATDLCSECDQIKLTKELEAAEAIAAFNRTTQEKELERKHTRKAAEVDAERTVAYELLKAGRAGEIELAKLYHTTIAEVAKGSIERARDSAKYLQVAATAILGIYSALLGLVFSVTNNPLPIRGVWAGVFLGLSVAMATAYLAFVKPPPSVTMKLSGESLTQLQHARTAFLTKWIAAAVNTKRWVIRASVVALALGVALMAAPFVAASRAPDVPSAPAVPSIPGSIDPSVRDAATSLFASQLEDYRNSVAARAEVLAAAKLEAKNREAHENGLNWFFALLALIGGPLFLIGIPAIAAWKWDKP